MLQAEGGVDCVGLVETWAGGISGTGVFDEAVSLNVVTGRVRVSGTETFVGSVGVDFGTLEWAYQGSGRVDRETFAVIFIDGEQHFTGGTLPGSWLSGAKRSSGP